MNQNTYRLSVELISACTVPPHLSGFIYLSEAVVLKSETYNIKLENIYKSLAQIHRCTHRAISRSITYAISQSENIREYLGIKKKDFVFNGKVIAILALKLRAICQTTEKI